VNRISPRRLGVFLRRLSPLDRIALAIVLLYALFRAARPLGFELPFARFLGFLVFLALIYFAVRLLPWVRSQLLWRLRNRLIVAYVFIAVVPVVLLIAMAGVASYLLYLQFGAHLLHDHLNEQIATIGTDLDALSDELEAEAGEKTLDADLFSRPRIAALLQADKEQWPGFEVLPNRGQHLLQPGRDRFKGLVELEGKLWLAAAQRRPTSQGTIFVMARAPVTPSILDRLGSELGPIQLILLKPAAQRPVSGLMLETDNGVFYTPGEEITSVNRRLAPPANWFDVRVNGAATFEAPHVDPAQFAAPAPVLASFSLRPMMVNRQLFPSVGAVGPLLMNLLIIVAVVFLVLEIAALAIGFVLSRTMTRAVEDLYDATLHLRRGDFGYRVRVQQRDQLGSLGESFNEMTSSISDLIAEQRQRQRLEHEISIAREVQEQLFPRSLPSISGLQLAAICRPARSVSGDYYDFIQLGPHRVAIALADISGKGIFAALLMASLQAALRSMASLNGSGDGTAALVARLNNHLFKNTSDDRYATFFYAVYDGDSNTLTYTNAGHLSPFFVSDAGVQQLDEGGTVVGMFEDVSYAQGTLKVTPGSVLVAFSDGLTEPENVYGEEFGMQRLKEEILRQRAVPSERLAENLIAAADQWSGTPEQADDITVVVVRMN
jgi:phosphoserine phosphatase RsbU/P